MIYHLVAIKDRAIDAFQPPFSVRALGEAIRAFQDAVRKNDNVMNSHPEDYDLYEIGTFDDSNGKVTNTQAKQIAIGKHYQE